MGYMSGKTGFVTIGGAGIPFEEWSFDIETVAVPIKNFDTNGYEQSVEGFTVGTLEMKGAWNVGGMDGITSGQVYTFNLGLDTGVFLTVDARVTKISPRNKADETPTVTVSARSTGPFTGSLS